MAKWTQEEVERAKAIKAFWPSLDSLRRNGYLVQVLFRGTVLEKTVRADAFPSIQDGQTVMLEDIING